MTFGPIVMNTVGDIFTKPARIGAIVWTGETTAGDEVELSSPVTGTLLWPARTGDTDTYLGISFGDRGLDAPHGFRLTKISSGRVIVYLSEN
jgi:hypothetical protein